MPWVRHKLVSLEPRPPRVERIIKGAAEACGITRRELLAGRQSPANVRARRMACLQLRALGFSLPEIGRYLCLHHIQGPAPASDRPAEFLSEGLA